MPTILTHPAIALALGTGLGSRYVPRRLLAAGVLFSIVPDADVYLQAVTTSVGHRGITHTLVFAIACGIFAASIAPALEARRAIAFLFVLACTASHPVLDMFTNGGTGIPFFWPVDDERYFMPWQVIEVSPLGIRRFFTARGIDVLASELRWVWAPAVVLAVVMATVRVTLAPANERLAGRRGK